MVAQMQKEVSNIHKLQILEILEYCTEILVKFNKFSQNSISFDLYRYISIYSSTVG